MKPEGTSAERQLSRIVLRPIGSPLALGFLALGGATVVLSGLQLGWYGAGQTTAVALALILFAFPLQSLAAVLAFLARDASAGTGMGVLAATWLSTGVIELLTPPFMTSPALGVLLVFAGAALVVPALAAALGKLIVALVLCTAALRFVLSGVYQFTASSGVQLAAGIVGLILLVLAYYASLALAVEDVRRKTVLPTLRRGWGAASLRGESIEQLAYVEHEAGVREQL